MSRDAFDYSKADSQATVVTPVNPTDFDYDAYQDYEAERRQRCARFWQGDSGVLVYRRMRVADVFSHGCRDMQQSLAWQLGALQQSMQFPADVPNFLEPWYGIGTVAAAYGADYIWEEGQAPAVDVPFSTVHEALAHEPVPVAETAIGRHTLAMIDCFREQTGGRLPISLTDTQSPLNISAGVADVNDFLMQLVMEPEAVQTLLTRLADLLIDFTHEQQRRLGDTLVWPGHGFASSRTFTGLGMSDDNALMMSGDHYLEVVGPATERAGEPFGGPVFHSCGNWSDRIPAVCQLKNLRMVDGAFGPETDPQPNPAEPFPETFADTGIVVNARVVGDPDQVRNQVRRLWRPGMKLIVVTYCETPALQQEAYQAIHEICQA